MLLTEFLFAFSRRFVTLKAQCSNQSLGLMQGVTLFGNPFGFGKSKARALMPNEINVHFEDVAGIDEAKEDIVEIVGF